MKKLNLFIPITKVDEENRLVYGVLAAEELDNSGEIFDYASSKPNFEKWSEDQFEASNGLSKGNVRAMHTAIAAGKLTDISYDDDAKVIEGVAKVVDDGEWNKVLEGVYTGFSMGGRYEKRWNDNGQTRYTALPVEMSLVDKPCIKSALFSGLSKTFMLQKADGSVEEREFAVDDDSIFKGHETQNRNDKGKWSGGHKHETTSHGGSDPTGHGAAEAAPTVKTGELGLAIDKSDKGDATMYVPTNDEILPVAQSLAKAAGKTDADWLEYADAARDQITAEKSGGTVAKADDATVENAEHTDDMCKVTDCPVCAEKAEKAATGETAPGAEGVAKAAGGPDEGDHSGEGDQEPAASAEEPVTKVTPAGVRQTWTASDGTTFEKKADCVAHEEKLAKGDAPASLSESLDSALAVVGALAKGEAVVEEPAAVVEEQPLGKSIDTQLLELADFIAGPDLRKGLYQVATLTQVLRGAASIYADAKREAAREGDGSGVPATLLEAAEKLGQGLIDMATEEVGEMLTELRESGDADDAYYYPECCYLSAKTMGLEKADADEFFTKAVAAHAARGGAVEKAALAPVEGEDELSKAVKAAGFADVAAFTSGIADLQKAAAELTEVKPKIEELTKFIDTLKTMPRPKAPTTGVAVEKAIDANGAGGGGAQPVTDLQKAEAMLAGLSGEDIARLAIKISQQHGQRLSLNG